MRGASEAFPNERVIVNRERAERRRALARTVSERIAAGSIASQSFDHDLLAHHAQTRIAAASAVPMLVALVALVATLWLPQGVIAVWAGATLSVHLGVLFLCSTFLAGSAASRPVRRWQRRLVAGEFATALCFAGLILSVAASRQPGVEIFQFAILLSLQALAVILAATLPGGVFAATAPVVLTLVGLFALRLDIPYLALSLLSIGSEVIILSLAQRLQSSAMAVMRIRAEKDNLIAELGMAKAMSDQSRRRAEEANLAKSRFLATMSHELRTPLNAILGFSEVMKNEILGPMQNPVYRDYAGDIHASGQHLLSVINEILDLSRIEAGRYELDEAPVRLAALVEDCESLVRLRARNKSLAISRLIEPDLPPLIADERSVRQVILNLLSNAIKFTPAGGAIDIRAGWTAGGGQYVSIRDDGPGIPEDELPIVMSAFGQGASAIRSAEQGTGLGLPIVQALMTMHGGTLVLRSDPPEGTEAIAAFPRARVLEPQAGASPEEAPQPAGWPSEQRLTG